MIEGRSVGDSVYDNITLISTIIIYGVQIRSIWDLLLLPLFW
jgi:hypothetical protein